MVTSGIEGKLPLQEELPFDKVGSDVEPKHIKPEVFLGGAAMTLEDLVSAEEITDEQARDLNDVIVSLVYADEQLKIARKPKGIKARHNGLRTAGTIANDRIAELFGLENNGRSDTYITLILLREYLSGYFDKTAAAAARRRADNEAKPSPWEGLDYGDRAAHNY